MKIVFKVLKTGSGNDIYFTSLCKGLKERGVNSEIIYYSKYFQFVPFLLRFINKRTDGDIIHSNVEYAWAFKEKDKPLYISLLHNVFEKEFQKHISFPQKIYYQLILKPSIKISLKVAHKIVAISKYTKQSFIREFGNYPIKVIYCAVDLNKFKPIKIKTNDKRFKLLFVGNLIKRKGADLLPKIMKKLGPDFVLYYTSGLRSEIPKSFNLPNMISLGKLTEKKLIEEYNKCDALLFPSRLEGFGYTVVEAMACGKPVIVTHGSSLSELVDEESGYKCKQDDINDFVEKIKLLKIKVKRSSYQHRNLKKARKMFSFEKFTENYRHLYSGSI